MTGAKIQHETIEAAAFKPSGGDRGGNQSLGRLLLWSVLASALVLLAGAAWLFTGQSVQIEIEPLPEQLELVGNPLRLKLADRWLLRPGEYRVNASLAGYHALSEAVVVDDRSEQIFEFTLQRLPGYLKVLTAPDPEPGQAEVLIDGEKVGQLPLSNHELEPGDYALQINAPRYQPFATQFSIEGGGEEEIVAVELQPAWAEVSIESEPAGATVLVDGEAVGITPLIAEIVEGEREVELQLDAYQPWLTDLTVVAQQAQQLPPVSLRKADYQIRVASRPAGASVTVDGEYRGQSPLNLELAPDNTYRIGLSKSGYRPARRNLAVEAGRVSTVSVSLDPILGRIELTGSPSDAQVWIDGKVSGPLNQTLELPSRPHRLEVRKTGYQSYQATITPSPNLPQTIDIALLSTQQIQAQQTPKNRSASNGYAMRLIEPGGPVRMGSPRRDQGRRNNEQQVRVQLQRPYYIGLREVTNEQYSAFDTNHDSGVAEQTTLSLKKQPAVRMSWQRAAAFCNWLSDKDGLPPAYVNEGGSLVPASPMTTGYRLPTESEWVFASRYQGDHRSQPLRFSWGDQFPPPTEAGNFAGTEAIHLVARVLNNYADNAVAASEVGGFTANALGLQDLSGNVREWMHDRYGIRAGGSSQPDPMGPTEGEGHVIRGSSWQSGNLAELRLAWRDVAATGRSDLGFRVARYAR